MSGGNVTPDEYQDWFDMSLDEKPKKWSPKKIVTGILLIVLIVAIGIVGLITLKRVAHDGRIVVAATDTGVQSCKQIATNATKTTDDSDNAPITEDEFLKAKEPFEKSRYADIKTAGVNLVSALYKADQAAQQDSDDENALAEALATITSITTYYTQLQTACEVHGVTIPPLPS